MPEPTKAQAFTLRHLLPTLVLALPLAGLADFWIALFLSVCLAVVVRLSANRLIGLLATAKARRIELSDQLCQSGKLAAIGQMSSGIAHEINTPLAVIAQEAELSLVLLQAPPLADLPEAKDLLDSAQQISLQVERCRDITHKVLNFARRMEAITQATDVNRLVEDMALLVDKEAKLKDVRIIRDFDPDLATIETDPSLLRQVVLNLMINGVQAIEGQGVVTVRTRADGFGARIEVADTGCGIPREHLDKIFNPFFTTKPPGKGTGLGLSISLNIVERLGGTIEVDSEPGKGTTFCVRLPAKQENPAG